jgi:SAM-dependent methyltransferase
MRTPWILAPRSVATADRGGRYAASFAETGARRAGGVVLQRQMVELLVCPHCGRAMEADTRDGGTGVACSAGHRFPGDRGYLDLSAASAPDTVSTRTFESFGYEWNAFDDVRPEDAEFAEVYFRDLDLHSLDGRKGLDAGCGKGRYTRFVAAHLGALVALDGSDAVEAAARNLAPFTNVVVVKADLRTAPIAAHSMDFVMCLGVLHHLADPRAGFAALVRTLAPGGRILVYLYSRPAQWGVRRVALDSAAMLRRLTVRIPHRVLRMLSVPVAALLYVGIVAPGALADRFSRGALARLPMASYRGKPFRSLVLDTFDRLSAPVEHRYVWSELAPWFADEGLVVDAVREQAGWFVLAHRATGAS